MKERFELPDDQCERLTRTETQAVTMLLTSMSNLRYAREDLKKRLECVPSGKARMNMVIGQFESLIRDVCGTVTDKQRKHLQNICKDMEVRLMPKMMNRKVSVVLTVDEAKELIDAAQAKCTYCFKDYEESRECKLCKLLECAVPLEDYSSLSCPYSGAKWEEEE